MVGKVVKTYNKLELGVKKDVHVYKKTILSRGLASIIIMKIGIVVQGVKRTRGHRLY